MLYLNVMPSPEQHRAVMQATVKGETLTFYCCEWDDVSPVDLAIMTRQTGHKQRRPVVSVWLSQRTRLLAVQRPWLEFQNSSLSLAWIIHLKF